MYRANCTMYHCVQNTLYCDYYDFAFMECSKVKVCPEGLDEDDEYEEYPNWDENEEY